MTDEGQILLQQIYDRVISEQITNLISALGEDPERWVGAMVMMSLMDSEIVCADVIVKSLGGTSTQTKMAVSFSLQQTLVEKLCAHPVAKQAIERADAIVESIK